MTRSSNPNFSICVYCGSRPGNKQCYSDAAQDLGTWIGENGGQLVYGGGKNGLMGEVAKATLGAGGRVIGVIPQSLVEREWANEKCSELHIVQTMHERKQLMSEKSDAFLALPGGIGTFEELFEIWTWRHLGYHNKPIGVLNTKGFYDPLLKFLEKVHDENFLTDLQMDLMITGTEVKLLMNQLLGNIIPKKLNSS